MKFPIEIISKWVPFKAHAITLFPFIIYKKGYENSPCLRVHERFHWYQARKWGVLPWYLAYLLLLLVYIGRPSREHPLEKPAYEKQWKCQEEYNSKRQ